MNCPSCETVNLTMSERSGIEIDYCPQCRGVWLDRGELDKIIERSAATSPVAAPPTQERDYSPPQDDRNREQHRSGDYYKHKKKKGFLGELFDFD